jgi:hypothetical protein
MQIAILGIIVRTARSKKSKFYKVDKASIEEQLSQDRNLQARWQLPHRPCRTIKGSSPGFEIKVG